jgi:hypothetical protein
MSDPIQARALTIPQEVELARRAMRGEAAYQALGYQPGAAAASSQSSPNPCQNAVINVTAAATTPIITGVSGQRIEVMEVFLYTDTQMALQFLDGIDDLSGLLNGWPANSGFFFPFTGQPHWSLSKGNSLNLVTGGAGQVSGFVVYRMVA